MCKKVFHDSKLISFLPRKLFGDYNMSRRRKNLEDLGTKQIRPRLEELLASNEEGSESEEDNVNVSTSVPPSPPQFGPYDHLQDGQEESHNEETKVEMTVDVECHPGGMTMSPKVKSFERRIKKNSCGIGNLVVVLHRHISLGFLK